MKPLAGNHDQSAPCSYFSTFPYDRVWQEKLPDRALAKYDTTDDSAASHWLVDVPPDQDYNVNTSNFSSTHGVELIARIIVTQNTSHPAHGAVYIVIGSLSGIWGWYLSPERRTTPLLRQSKMFPAAARVLREGRVTVRSRLCANAPPSCQ